MIKEQPLNPPLQIATMGDMVMDILVLTDYSNLRVEGETVGRVRHVPGGSAANFAVWAARTLGARGQISFIGKVGLDISGPALIEGLQREGVNACVNASHDGSSLPTGTVLVVSSSSGQRLMISDPGAGRQISVVEVEQCLGSIVDLRAFHLTSYSLFSDPPRPAALRACEIAHQQGALVCLDPSSASQIVAMGGEFDRLLRVVLPDLLIPTLDEGRTLTGETEPLAVAASLHQYAPLVVLKLGSEGCLVSTAAGLRQHLPATPTPVLDVTGAGDSFAAAFLCEYLLTGDPLAAGAAANALGAKVVAMLGAR